MDFSFETVLIFIPTSLMALGLIYIRYDRASLIPVGVISLALLVVSIMQGVRAFELFSLYSMSAVLNGFTFWASLINLTAVALCLAPYYDAVKSYLTSKVKSPFHGELAKTQTYGSASWMEPAEVAMLTRNRGLIIGKQSENKKAKLLKEPLEAHALTIAPTRKGKFTACIAPNLLFLSENDWPGSLILIEPKGEGYQLAAATRAVIGRNQIRIDPFAICGNSGETYAFNPMSTIESGPGMVRDIHAIVDALLIPPESHSEAAKHFYESSKIILSGIIAYVVLDEGQPKDLLQVKKCIDGAFAHDGHMLFRMGDFNSKQESALVTAALCLINTVSDRERGSFYSTLATSLSWLNYPEISKSVSASSVTPFDYRNIMKGHHDIYIMVPADMLATLRPWIRLFVTLAIRYTAETKPKHRMLMMIDEMHALGRIDKVAESYHLSAGYGLSIWGFTQNLSDLEKVYGTHDAMAMLGNSQFVQFFNTAKVDKRTSEYLSSILGDVTAISNSRSESSSNSSNSENLNLNFSSQGSNSKSEIRRSLLTPDEVSRLPQNSLIAFLNNKQNSSCPLLAYKANYYEIS